MESRRNSIPMMRACRFCLTQDETVSSLYDRIRAPKNTISLHLQIMACVGVEVFPSDRMLSYICDRCRFFMDLCYKYKQICRQADEAILQYIQNDEPLDPIPWPSKLTKLLVSPKRTKKGKAEVDTSQIVSNDEESEEEGNVYNIKIGEGDDEDPTCIKVVKSGNKLHVSKDDPKTKAREDSKMSRQMRGQASDRPFPCQFCNKSFTKSHHFTRHMRSRHKSNSTSARSPFGLDHGYGCDQCDATFATQDELIYHSAKHATENLTCPLCHETFEVVEQVSAHIKTHVDGAEFMCDYCELVFTSKDKLDAHIQSKHDDESNEQEGTNEESIEEEDEFEDDNINVKEVGGEMIVEIKKHSEFVMSEDSKKTADMTNSEESESEATYTELATVEAVVTKPVQPAKVPAVVQKPAPAPAAVVAASPVQKAAVKPAEKKEDAAPTASILRKAEEIKRKVAQKAAEASSNSSSPKVARAEVTVQKVSTPGGASTGGNDKSLRLLEKELQELKRTNPSKDTSDSKTPAKSVEILRSKRPQLHTSTPKPRAAEEKKAVAAAKTPAVEKKQPARVVTKENKVPDNKVSEKEAKATNNAAKEEKAKEDKEKETPKAVKNGEAAAEENVRRSSRGAKVKDYAKMIRDKETSSDDTDDNDEEYKEIDKSTESRGRGRRPVGRPAAAKPASPPAASPAGTRKRGRPRKDVKVPPKVKKANEEEDEEATPVKIDKSQSRTPSKDEKQADEKMEVADKEPADNKKEETPVKSVAAPAQSPNVMVSPKGTTLKKVAIKQLPPGVRPMPLPMNARSMGPGELCEMQIGKKVVKVQKIVMTKAEVEAMAKKGLVEMKDGTMVLKQGIKLPATDTAAFKTMVADPDKAKPSPAKEKAVPTRCDVDDEV
ncbi:nucleolar protein dao-5 [Plutella xylostella]|uniref:nucleolar protein dao-5 n=1 Tax=Plutella xylostella TaxID=51655 RepID=UPI0020322856|nr:nucleolar protein dao-5 [Plutella xylostella]